MTDLISKQSLTTLLEREMESGAESTRDGLRLALDILRYAPTATTIRKVVKVEQQELDKALEEGARELGRAFDERVLTAMIEGVKRDCGIKISREALREAIYDYAEKCKGENNGRSKEKT